MRAKAFIDVFAIPALVGLGVRWAASDLGAPLGVALVLQLLVQMAVGLRAIRKECAS